MSGSGGSRRRRGRTRFEERVQDVNDLRIRRIRVDVRQDPASPDFEYPLSSWRDDILEGEIEPSSIV